ncbi:unnamed protein product [Musa textilis]
MDLYMFQGSQKQQGQAGGSKFRQTNINDACDKKIRRRTIQYIARFFYQVGLLHSTTRLDSFKKIIEAIERYGAGLKPPSFYKMRVPLLQKELNYTNDLLKGHKESWATYGCSIILDAWTDRRRKSIINFIVL